MEVSDLSWRKSSYSSNGGGNCVEVGNGSGVVAVRDTTDRDGGTLTFTASAWAAFAASLKNLAQRRRSPSPASSWVMVIFVCGLRCPSRREARAGTVPAVADPPGTPAGVGDASGAFSLLPARLPGRRVALHRAITVEAGRGWPGR